MAKVADVKLFWTKSVSTDVSKVEVYVTINGTETKTEVGPEVQEIMVEVAAMGVVAFRVVVTDTEGYVASSETFTFTLGDLVPPQPATALGFEVTGVRDVPDPVPVP